MGAPPAGLRHVRCRSGETEGSKRNPAPGMTTGSTRCPLIQVRCRRASPPEVGDQSRPELACGVGDGGFRVAGPQ